MKKQSKAILSLALCLAVIMSVFTVVPVSATENANGAPTPNILADFENGINTFPVINNVYSGATHFAIDTTMVDFSSTEEALNGSASLKVNVPEGNSRTEVVFAEGKLNGSNPTYKYNVSNSTDGGMLFRLKINNDVSTAGHNFAVLLSQSGVAKNTHLASGAVLYDLEGNKIETTSTALHVTIPSNFNGFVYLPFATARSVADADGNKSYDDYINNPDSMVKLTENYKIAFMFGSWSGNDKTWDNTEVLLDDICIIGAEDGAAWNTMRTLGYEDVLCAVQPNKYTLPITHEDLMQPIQSFQVIKLNENATDYTYSISASLTNDADEVLLGNISAKISTETVNGGTTDGVIESFRTNTITFEGIEALSTEKIVAAASDNYAYFKMRIKVPTNEANGTYNIWPVIKQGNNCYRFEFNGSAYNADGTKNNNVPFAKNKAIQLPSGFDGYIYMPVWSLRDTDWNLGQRSTTAYQTKNYTDPALDSDFDFFIHFAQNGYNLDNAEIIIDDMGFVMGDYTGFTFEDGMINVTPAAKGYTSQGWKEVSLDNISRITGENALNGNASILLDIEDVYSVADDGTINYHSYNAAVFAMDGIAEGRADGVMLRMKLLDDPSTGTAKSAHQMYLMFGKKKCIC